MTYPNQPGTPGYPQQYPAQPQYAPQPAQQYPPPWTPAGYPAQPQYAPQPQMAPPAPQLARGSLEDFIDQPTGGGGAATSKFFTPQRPVGSWLQLRVTRDLNASDVRQQTDKFGTPLTFKSSGKPKWVLIIPCQVLGSSDGSHQTIYPEGQVTVWLKGVPSDSFKTAMSAAGISDPARALALGQLGGAEFYMIGAGTKQFGNGNPANMFDFQYTSNGRELLDATIDKAITAAPAQVQAPALPDTIQQYQQQAAQLAQAAGMQAPQFSPPTAAPTAAPSFTPVPGTAPGNPVQQAGPFAQPAFQPPVPGSGMPPVPPAGLPPVPQPGVTPPPAPAQPFNGPQAPALDAEKAALLARLQGQG